MLSLTVILRNKQFFASAWFFITHSLLFSTWLLYIPSISEVLQVSDSQLGIALSFKAFGAFSSMLISPAIIRKFGEGVVASTAAIAFSLALFGPFLASSYLLFCSSLFLMGACAGLMDLAMNALVATIEKQQGAFIMASCHGFWSVGGFFGASIGTFAAVQLEQPLLHVGIVVIIMILLQLYFRRWIIGIRRVDHRSQRAITSFPVLHVLGLAAIGLFAMLGEGAVADWSAMYMKHVATIRIEFVGLAYASFALMMAVARFSMDHISHRYGPRRIIIGGSLIAATGFLLILTANPIAVIIGFGIVGAGYSGIVPELYRIVSNIEGVAPTNGVAVIAASGYLGGFFGPALIGFLADAASLRVSFAALMTTTIMSVTIASFSISRRPDKNID